MCRMVGLILGAKRRKRVEYQDWRELFSWMLVASVSGGPHATGVAVVRQDGGFQLCKRPLPAEAFLATKACESVLGGVDYATTALLGHTRWATRGAPENPLNNHPLRDGRVLVTHNGTVVNAHALLQRHGLRPEREVDTEALVRLASLYRGRPEHFLKAIREVEGQMSAVVLDLDRPARVTFLKGNKPLHFACHKRHRVLAYATDPHVLEDLVMGELGWRVLDVPPMTVAAWDREDLSTPVLVRPLAFRTRARLPRVSPTRLEI